MSSRVALARSYVSSWSLRRDFSFLRSILLLLQYSSQRAYLPERIHSHRLWRSLRSLSHPSAHSRTCPSAGWTACMSHCSPTRPLCADSSPHTHPCTSRWTQQGRVVEAWSVLHSKWKWPWSSAWSWWVGSRRLPPWKTTRIDSLVGMWTSCTCSSQPHCLWHAIATLKARALSAWNFALFPLHRTQELL